MEAFTEPRGVPPAEAVLFGREDELAALAAVVDSIEPTGSALVVCGPPGIGKSAVLAALRRHAEEHDLATLTTVGVQSETKLPFAGLHRLLRPLLASADELPEPQRIAILSAFGIASGPAPDLFLSALATLNLLAVGATRSRLVLFIDDAQWLDPDTLDVLAFVARRLEAEPITMLIAARHGHRSGLLDAGSTLTLEPLPDDTARALLAARAPALTPGQRRQVLQLAAGNPLALVELPAVVTRRRPPTTELPLLERLPLSERLEQAFALQQAELPPETRSLLVVAAADDVETLDEILSAASLLHDAEISDDGLAPAVAARLVEVEGTELRFRHPLIRSAIYQSTGQAERRRAHAALADVLADQPDRRAWHRAAAAGHADENVAAELEAAAERAQQRGAIAIAVSALERAATLSTNSERRIARLLQASELAFELGRHELARRLVEEVERLELAPHQRARVAWIRESLPEVPADRAQVHVLIGLAEDALGAGDADLALKLLRSAAWRTWWSDPGDAVRERVFAAADAVGVDELDPRLIAVLAIAAPDHSSPLVIERLSRIHPAAVIDPVTGWLLGMAAHARGDPERATVLLGGAATALRAQGRLALLAQVRVMQAWDEIHLGNWVVARSSAEEGGRLARETAQPGWTSAAQIAQALLVGVGGDEERAEALADEAERGLLEHRLVSLVGVLQLARGLTALTAGRPEAAYDHLRRMFDPADAAYIRRECNGEIVYFADAAAQTGRRDDALHLVDEFDSLGALTRSPGMCKGATFARPLLAAAEDSEAVFEAALGSENARWPFFRARVQLAHGTWLRRQRRVAEARAPLRAARQAFAALGAVPWAERARQELRASGERSRSRVADARDELTPQELHIAGLAADGLSNREIGEQLYLSPRTVASHLYRLFPKLGVTSRAQLAAALARTEVRSSG